MLQIVTDQQEAIGLWLVEHIPDMTNIPGGYFCLGVVKDGALCGAALYTNYRPVKNGGDIEVFCAGHGWLSRRVIRTIFAHAFSVLGCNRMTAVVRKSNKPSRRLLEGLGFSLEGRLREGFGPRQHSCVYGLLREEWMRSPLNKKV